MDNLTAFRVEQLKAMHEVMTKANDERIYMSWASEGVPDCPSDDDFEYIASDTEQYEDIIKLFVRLVSKKDYKA